MIPEKLNDFFKDINNPNYFSCDLSQYSNYSDFTTAKVPYICLKNNHFKPEEILEEIQNNIDCLVPYNHPFSKYDDQGWYTAHLIYHDLIIQKKKYDGLFGNITKAIIKNTDIYPLFPKITKMIKTLPFKKIYICLISLIEPGGYINIHTDTEENDLASFQCCISGNDDIFIKFNEHYDSSISGEIKLYNIGLQHAVFNNSNSPRIHVNLLGNFTDDFLINTKSYISEYRDHK